MRFALFAAADLHDCKQIVAALRRGCADDDIAACLAFEIRTENRRRGRGCLFAIDMREIHAALELAEIVGARDDFLARIAAFLEADAADALEVDHLRDERFLCFGQHDRHAGANFEPLPAGRANRRRRASQRFPDPHGPIGCGEQFKTLLAQADDIYAISMDCVERGGGNLAEFRERLGGPAARKAKANRILAGIRSLDLGAQNVHREPFKHAGQQRLRQLQFIAVVIHEQQHARKHAAFGRAIRGILTYTAGNAFDVIGQLSLQKALRIFSAELHQAEMRQIANHRAFGAGAQFAVGRAEIAYLLGVDVRAGRNQMAMPVGNHVWFGIKACFNFNRCRSDAPNSST